MRASAPTSNQLPEMLSPPPWDARLLPVAIATAGANAHAAHDAVVRTDAPIILLVVFSLSDRESRVLSTSTAVQMLSPVALVAVTLYASVRTLDCLICSAVPLHCLSLQRSLRRIPPLKRPLGLTALATPDVNAAKSESNPIPP